MTQRPAFTLAEVLLALTVAGVGLLALVGATASAWRLRTRADLAAQAALVARTRAERLAATPCDLATSGTLQTGAFTERWTVRRGPRALLLVDAAARYTTPAGHDSATVHTARWCE